MSLCFIDPADAIRAIADSVGREARRQLLGEAVRAWVDEIPDDELEAHYARAIAELDEHDISMLAAWHASMDVGHPVPNRDFLMGAFTVPGPAPARGAEARRRLPRRGGGRPRRHRGARARDGARLALAAPPHGARRRGRRALRLGPRRLRQLARARRSAASISGIACSLERKWTAAMPSSRAAATLSSTSSTNRHSGGADRRRRSAPGSARRSRARAFESRRTPSRRSPRRSRRPGASRRHSGSHSRTLLVRSAIR